MNSKSSKLLGIILILVAAALFVTGCGKSGNRFENQLPSISITSFEGWSDEHIPANVDTLDHEYIFQQKIFWHATDPDGIITGYAFRVLDENHQPIAVPGYNFIADAASGLIPDKLLTSYGEGWVMHYLPGADQSLSLDDPEAKRTIWTNQKYAVINFPAADDSGAPEATISYFEVLAIDNRGDITKNSAKRRFRTNSNRPVCNVSTTKGNPDGGNVGSGITLRFSMSYPDSLHMLVSPIPARYEFKMMKVNIATQQVIPDTETEWFSTEGQKRINEFRLTKRSQPPMVYDYLEDGTSLGSSTRIIARAVDLGGVYSAMTMPDTDRTPNWQINFKIKPGFRPKTLLYSQKLLALGENHFEDRGDKSTPEDLPYTVVQNEPLFATPLFRSLSDTLSVVYSPDLRIYVRWGWLGEYGLESSGVPTYPEDNPYIKKFDSVMSEADPEVGYAGGENYYSEITHFDVRYDGEPYYFPPYPGADHNHTDDDGTVWLRIPLYSPLKQSIVLTGNQITPGNHVFEVRAVDSQDEVSKYPATFNFNVVPYIPPASREGILVIYDDPIIENPSPPIEFVNERYENMTSDIEKVTMVKYGLSGENGSYKDARGRYLAYPDLQKYRLVIYHADNIADGGTLENEIDGLSLFFRAGGNLLISHTAKFASKAKDISNRRGFTLLEYMGLPMVPNLNIGLAVSPNFYFQNAVGSNGYQNLGLQYSTHPSNTDGTPSFNPLIEFRKGLHAVAYHNETAGVPNIYGEPIFRYGCKPVDFPTSPPTQAVFDRLNDKVVGVRKINSNGARVYTFTFPLSYMLDVDTKALINKIWSEVQ
ncbi:MAG: hypothetical protein M0Q16_01900 [Candidatus Cloacimonetes bacterium]|nr:hypothetical protein [Candidatus Cloacimonadota bacterium]MCK9184110.1 hypothetical protein [Candidatus Cloacimonadota bacterium]